LCFDGDNAGQRAAVRAMERVLPILRPGVSARFAFMPQGQDPDDLLRQKGISAMQGVIDQSIPLHDMIWRTLVTGKDFTRPEARASLMDGIERMIVQIADHNIQQSYRQILKDKFYQNFRGGTKGKMQRTSPAPIQIKRPNANQDLPSRLVLGIIIRNPFLYDIYEEKLASFKCTNQGLDALRQNVISILSDTSGITHEKLLDALKNKGINGDHIASLNMDMKLHASYVFDTDAHEAIETGLKELLDRVAV